MGEKRKGELASEAWLKGSSLSAIEPLWQVPKVGREKWLTVVIALDTRLNPLQSETPWQHQSRWPPET